MQLSVFRSGRLLLLTAVLTSTSLLASEAVFLDESEISWKVNDFNVSRWKTLVGGDEGGELAEADVQFGRWQLAPGATYHAHRHEVPRSTTSFLVKPNGPLVMRQGGSPRVRRS